MTVRDINTSYNCLCQLSFGSLWFLSVSLLAIVFLQRPFLLDFLLNIFLIVFVGILTKQVIIFLAVLFFGLGGVAHIVIQLLFLAVLERR